MADVLYAAAGGGGDAIAAAMLHRLIDPDGDRPVIATWAWERLMVDPVPALGQPDDPGLRGETKDSPSASTPTSPRPGP